MNSSKNLPLISVVIPNYNGAEYLGACLRSLQAQTLRDMEIVVVDNASLDESVKVVQTSAPEAIVIRESRNLGFAGGVNAGIRLSKGEWIAVLNNDTEVQKDWLDEFAKAIAHRPEAAFFACRILDFADRSRIYSAGDCYLRGGIGYRRGQGLKDREDFCKECEVFSASGCAALYRRKVVEELGGFDEHFFAYLEDVDLGFRIQAAGYRGYYVPRAVVYHHGAATGGGEFSPLTVRLRTRNSLLLLLKNTPAMMFLQCFPMIFLAQISWFLRAAAHGRLWSYFKGLAAAFLLFPAMIRERPANRQSRKGTLQDLLQRILQSESLARRDFIPPASESDSAFLKLYFRMFKGKMQTAEYGR
ncbi:MAG: glycosyltransferase [Acidobacteria bacterium]|nr:glycosyltransferase [Acidobacteriota bacterium]